MRGQRLGGGLPVQNSRITSTASVREPSSSSMPNHVGVASCFRPQRNAYDPRQSFPCSARTEPSYVLRYVCALALLFGSSGAPHEVLGDSQNPLGPNSVMT